MIDVFRVVAVFCSAAMIFFLLTAAGVGMVIVLRGLFASMREDGERWRP